MKNSPITLRLPDDLRAEFNLFRDSGNHKSDNYAAIHLIRDALTPHDTKSEAPAFQASDIAKEFRKFKEEVTLFMESAKPVKDADDDKDEPVTRLLGLSSFEEIREKVLDLEGEIAQMRDRFKQHSHENGKLRDPAGVLFDAAEARGKARREAEEREEAGLPPEPVAPAVKPAVVVPPEPSAEEIAEARAAKLKRTRETNVEWMLGELTAGTANGTTMTMLQAALKALGRDPVVLTEEQEKMVAANDAAVPELVVKEVAP